MQIQKPGKLVDVVMDKILSSIASGEFKTGERLPSLEELTKLASVSRSTMREAFKRLESLGVLEIKQGDGTYIKEFDIKKLISTVLPLITFNQTTLKDFLEARMIIELETVRLAAERADELNVAELRVILDKMSTVGIDSALYTGFDADFHIAIAKSTQNALLVNYILVIRDMMRKQQELISRLPEVMKISQLYHERIFTAIQQHQPEEAVSAMREHLANIPYRFVGDKLIHHQQIEA